MGEGRGWADSRKNKQHVQRLRGMRKHFREEEKFTNLPRSSYYKLWCDTDVKIASGCSMWSDDFIPSPKEL